MPHIFGTRNIEQNNTRCEKVWIQSFRNSHECDGHTHTHTDGRADRLTELRYHIPRMRTVPPATNRRALKSKFRSESCWFVGLKWFLIVPFY